MTSLVKIKEPIFIEGKAFTRKGLLEYSAEQLNNPGVPRGRKEAFAFMAHFLDPGEKAILQRSSGTTGDPKSFTLSRDAMMNSAGRTLEFFGLTGGEKALLCLPVHYIAGKMMVVRALLGGLDLLLQEPSSRPLEHMSEDVEFAAMVPLQIEESLQYKDPLGRISNLLIGGGELHPATRYTLSSMEAPAVYETFGMTETYTHFALKRINGPDPDSCFRLLKDVKISTDPRGCLEVHVPGITPGPVLTNDLVEINKECNGFAWLGRYDNLINSGGIKVIPELLEKQVREFLGKECLVLPEADRKLGHRLVFLVEFAGDDPPMDSWMKKLRARLSAYEIPKRILTTPSLPRNASMKPDRTRARNLLL